MRRQRLLPNARKGEILASAIRLARQPGGWNSITRAAVSHEAKCSEGIVSFHFGSMQGLRKEVMKTAIKFEFFDVIGQGIASGDRYALATSARIKAQAIKLFFAASEE
jgi:hypothetical protein